MNSVGAGAFFDVLNFGQMYGLHIFILPLVVATLIAAHLLARAYHGVVKPTTDAGGERCAHDGSKKQYYRGRAVRPV